MPMRGGAGNADEGSWKEGTGTIFDSIKIGVLKSDGTFTEISKSTVDTGVSGADTSSNVFVRIPKIYQKITDLGSSKIRLDLALHQFSGSSVHPAFTMNTTTYAYKDIGRYLGTRRSVNGTYTLISPATGTMSHMRNTYHTTARTYAKANGDQFGLMNYWDWDLVNKLFILAFKSFDSQSVLGKGYVEGSSPQISGGYTSGKSWMYGKSDTSTDHVSFLGIEDWWGNMRTFVDDLYSQSDYLYAGHMVNPSDDNTYKESLGAKPAKGTYSWRTCKAGEKNFFIGDTKSSSTTGPFDVDKQAYDAGDRFAFASGYYGDGTNAGAFYLCFDENAVGASSEENGYRLTHWSN